jgi:hypothetical protein
LSKRENKTNNRDGRRAFNSIITTYAEAKSADPRESAHIKGTSHGIVRVSLSDFISDVELTVKSVLDRVFKGAPALHKLFKDYYIGNVSFDRAMELEDKIKTTAGLPRIRASVEVQIGQAFKDRDIYPYHTYQQSVDVR